MSRGLGDKLVLQQHPQFNISGYRRQHRKPVDRSRTCFCSEMFSSSSSPMSAMLRASRSFISFSSERVCLRLSVSSSTWWALCEAAVAARSCSAQRRACSARASRTSPSRALMPSRRPASRVAVSARRLSSAWMPT